MGLVSPGLRRVARSSSLKGHLAIGHCRYSTTGAQHLGERPADVPAHRRRLDRARPQRQPDQHPRAARDGRRAARADGELDAPRPRRSRQRPTTPAWSPRCSPHHPDTLARGSARSRCCRSCAAPSASSSWTSTPCTPPATRRASARWSSAGSSAAGWSPARPPRSTSSAPRSSARSSPASWSRSTRTACARQQLRRGRRPRAASSSTSTSPAPTPRSPAAACTSARVEIGRRLAREHPVEADLVIPVPESGTPAAIGYAEATGIPYGQGLVKNSYVGPHLHPAVARRIRQLGIRLKLNPLRDVIARQAARRRRRLDRARQHPARAGPDAARGRRRARCTCGSPRRR